MRPRRLSVRAPAKINARLEVLGRRDDGYHELRTWMLALELADTLTGELDAAAAPGSVALSIGGPAASADIPRDERNLAARAAALVLAEVAKRAGERPGAVRLRLTKEVPSQAGLGGGSADAAAGLWLVEALLDVDLGAEWRRARLAELGSDTVFFEAARGRGAGLCTGRGELVEPADAPAPEWWVAAVTPAVVCPTDAVFRALEGAAGEVGPDRPSRRPAPGDGWTSSLGAATSWMHNDLEAAALRAVPELTAWRELFASLGAGGFRLTGSGSSFFALRPTAHEATVLLERVLAGAGERGLALRGRWVTRTDRFDGRPRALD